MCRNAWIAFVKSYAEFHYATNGYRLNELGSEVIEGGDDATHLQRG